MAKRFIDDNPKDRLTSEVNELLKRSKDSNKKAAEVSHQAAQLLKKVEADRKADREAEKNDWNDKKAADKAAYKAWEKQQSERKEKELARLKAKEEADREHKAMMKKIEEEAKSQKEFKLKMKIDSETTQKGDKQVPKTIKQKNPDYALAAIQARQEEEDHFRKAQERVKKQQACREKEEATKQKEQFKADQRKKDQEIKEERIQEQKEKIEREAREHEEADLLEAIAASKAQFKADQRKIEDSKIKEPSSNKSSEVVNNRDVVNVKTQENIDEENSSSARGAEGGPALAWYQKPAAKEAAMRRIAEREKKAEEAGKQQKLIEAHSKIIEQNWIAKQLKDGNTLEQVMKKLAIMKSGTNLNNEQSNYDYHPNNDHHNYQHVKVNFVGSTDHNDQYTSDEDSDYSHKVNHNYNYQH